MIPIFLIWDRGVVLGMFFPPGNKPRNYADAACVVQAKNTKKAIMGTLAFRYLQKVSSKRLSALLIECAVRVVTHE
jgi:hypothetical protein